MTSYAGFSAGLTKALKDRYTRVLSKKRDALVTAVQLLTVQPENVDESNLLALVGFSDGELKFLEFELSSDGEINYLKHPLHYLPVDLYATKVNSSAKVISKHETKIHPIEPS